VHILYKILFIKYVERNMIPNCPITKAKIIHAEGIFGMNVGSLKDKKIRKKTSRVVTKTEDLPTVFSMKT